MSKLRAFALILLIAVPMAMAAGENDDAAKIAELEAKVAALEARLAQMEGDIDAKIEAAIDSIAKREEYAATALREINTLSMQGKQIEAKAKMAEFQKKYAGTDAAKSAARLQQELAVVGKAAPAQFNAQKWFQGQDAVSDLAGDGTTLLVFWEVWCPHCKREVPKLQGTYEKFNGKGLQVIGLTKVNRGSTEQQVSEFIQANSLGYPVAKEGGEMSAYFNVSGVPAAAVVKDGKVVWRGHPARLSDQLLESWL
jgi:thiol-disulfide isomerase/thioredoxin